MNQPAAVAADAATEARWVLVVPPDLTEPAGADCDPRCVKTSDRCVVRLYSRYQGAMTNFGMHFRPPGVTSRHHRDDVAADAPRCDLVVSAVDDHRVAPSLLDRNPLTLRAQMGDHIDFAGHLWQITQGHWYDHPSLQLARPLPR